MNNQCLGEKFFHMAHTILENKCELELKRNALLVARKIQVEIWGNKVTLRGRVRNNGVSRSYG